MSNSEDRMTKLLDFPYGSYLMLRLEYACLCADELEAKIMRIIEMYMDNERRKLLQDHLNDPKTRMTKDQSIDITKDVWASISYRLFTYDLYDTVKSDNTLKRAIKSLQDKNFIRVKFEQASRYDAPKYQINIEVVQAELNKLKQQGKSGYQKLTPSKIDTLKNLGAQNLIPSGGQELIPSGKNLSSEENLRVSKIDTNSRSNNISKIITEEYNVIDDTATADVSTTTFFVHPFHSFLSFDDLMKPTTMIISLTSKQFESEMEDDSRYRIAEEIKHELSAKGFPVKVQTTHDRDDIVVSTTSRNPLSEKNDGENVSSPEQSQVEETQKPSVKETAPRRSSASGKSKRTKKDEIEQVLTLSEIAAPQKPNPAVQPYNVELFMKLADYYRGCNLPKSNDPRSRYQKALKSAMSYVQRKTPFIQVDKLFCYMLGRGEEIGLPDLKDQKWMDGGYNTDLWTVEPNHAAKWAECQKMEKLIREGKNPNQQPPTAGNTIQHGQRPGDYKASAQARSRREQLEREWAEEDAAKAAAKRGA